MTATPAPAPQAPPPKPAKVQVTKAAPMDIYQAILAASSSFGSLAKEANNTYLKSLYLSLPALLKAVREPLSDQGVIITSAFVQSGQQFVIETTLRHIGSGTEISSCFPVLDMSNPQKVGACATYGFRYSLMHLLGIAPEDDDGASIANPQQYAGPIPAGIERTAPANLPTPTQPNNWL